jgi:hypothetical protein
MNAQQHMKLIRQISIQADLFYTEAEDLGKIAHQNNLDRHQLKGLQRIAESAFKVSDVLDYIKIQTGRHEKWRNRKFGPKLLNYIREELKRRRTEVCRVIGLQEKGIEAQQVYLYLIRAFVRQMVAYYEVAPHLP